MNSIRVEDPEKIVVFRQLYGKTGDFKKIESLVQRGIRHI